MNNYSARQAQGGCPPDFLRSIHAQGNKSGEPVLLNAFPGSPAGAESLTRGCFINEISEIVRKCQSGDRGAQQELFDAYKGTILRLVSRFIGHQRKLDMQETIQKVYIELFRSLVLFRGEASFETWVYRIAAKVCMMQLREKYRKRVVHLIPFMDKCSHDDVQDDTYNPENELINRESTRRLHSALGKLRPDCRIILMLYEVDGKNISDIAQIMHIAQGTVKSLLFRTRKKLRHELGDILQEESYGNEPKSQSRALCSTAY